MPLLGSAILTNLLDLDEMATIEVYEVSEVKSI